jgi:hypothetical protein
MTCSSAEQGTDGEPGEGAAGSGCVDLQPYLTHHAASWPRATRNTHSKPTGCSVMGIWHREVRGASMRAAPRHIRRVRVTGAPRRCLNTAPSRLGAHQRVALAPECLNGRGTPVSTSTAPVIDHTRATWQGCRQHLSHSAPPFVERDTSRRSWRTLIGGRHQGRPHVHTRTRAVPGRAPPSAGGGAACGRLDRIPRRRTRPRGLGLLCGW